ncbi:MAG: hypothetical protein K5666_00120 [Bacilli bacterium]|nr:hypothetical protein [Bacilli bacterium]
MQERLLKKVVSKKKLDGYLKEFFDTYYEDIPPFIHESLEEDYLYGLGETFAPCYVMQFYDEYQLMLNKYNLYLQFIELLKHNHPDLSNMTILDVGGGLIPSLGRRLAKDAKHVMVVDRWLTDKNNPTNLEVIKKEITCASELPKADIVIGFMPCEVTNILVEHACKTDADFLLETCGCVHDDSAMYHDPMYYWYAVRRFYENRKKYIEEMVASSNLGECIELDSYKNIPYTIYTNKTK